VFVPHETVTDNGIDVSLGTAIDRLEIFPQSATEADCFTIKWSDVNCGSWSDFVAERQLPGDQPEPSCNISMVDLSLLAQKLATPTGPPAPTTVAPAAKIKRNKVGSPPSSSPKEPSSESDMSSEEERRRDPDYEPSSE